MTRNERYEKAVKPLLKLIEKDWGKRCESWDYEDFPELKDDLIVVGDPDVGRCPVCLVYERFDKFWKELDLEDNV